MRFRPIIMTSFAFILGVLPLVFATGAGAASRQSLGTAVCGGMLTSTVLAVFFVPVFYVAIQWLIELKNGPPKPLPGFHAPGDTHGLEVTTDAPPPEPVTTAPTADVAKDNGKPVEVKEAGTPPEETPPAPEKK